MDLGLKGRRAIVTGGSKGIGRRCADILADEGAHVAICARDQGEVAATVEALKARGVTAYGEALDVADKPALEAWVAHAGDALGGIDIVVANVSAIDAQNTEEAWRKQFEVDVMHTVRTVGAAMPFLERSDAARSSSSPASRAGRSTSSPAPTAPPRRRSSTTPTASPSSSPQDDPGQQRQPRQYLLPGRGLEPGRGEQP